MDGGSSSKKWLLYGANGYTGRLAAAEAKRRGMTPVLGGRNGSVIGAIAESLGFDSRVFGLDSIEAIAEQLKDIDVVLHCAGPFSATAKPMMAACAKAGAHYLDITGEIDVFEHAHARDAEWKDAGIVAMPGVGFDVVPSDCLAAMLARELPGASHLRMAFTSGKGKLSPGTAKTTVEGLSGGGKVRRDEELIDVPSAYRTRTIPFPGGDKIAVTIPWGDVSTAYHSTGIPNIEIYLGSTEKQIKQMKIMGRLGWLLGLSFVQSLAKSWIARNVAGPSETERAADRMELWGEVENENGDRAAMTLTTPEGYDLTVDASLSIVARMLASAPEPGALTPSKAFGPDFVLELKGVECKKLG